MALRTLLDRLFIVTAVGCIFLVSLAADQPKEAATGAADTASAAEEKPKRLSPEYDIWLDRKNNRVILGGEVAMREGTLEMFACLKGTKEHESVVACNTKAYMVHAALLALGAEPGLPVKFPRDDSEKYRPATGPRIDVTVFWTDEKGVKRRATGQSWIRSFRTKKAMEHPWVFAGSGFWVDGDTGVKHYMAEGGDLICVSNFPSATLDLPIESPQDNDHLMFEAFTEHIPPRGTKLFVTLIPRLEEKEKAADTAAEKTADTAAAK